jgi:WD40 repeat protein
LEALESKGWRPTERRRDGHTGGSGTGRTALDSWVYFSIKFSVTFNIFLINFQVIIGDNSGQIKVFNLTSGSFTQVTFFLAHIAAYGINRIKPSPFNNGKYVATCSFDNVVKIWDSSSWSSIRNYTGHTSSVFGLEWINEDTIASGGLFDKTIKIWSISSGQTIRTINPGLEVQCLKMLSNAVYLAAGVGYGGLIHIYNINTGDLVTRLIGHNHAVSDLALIGNDLLASSSLWYDKTIRLWNLTTYSTKFILQGHNYSVNGLKQISGDVLASASDDSTIKLWNITNGTLIRTLTGHTSGLGWSLDLLSDGQTMISGSGDKTLRLWNWRTGAFLNAINTSVGIRTMGIIDRSLSSKII